MVGVGVAVGAGVAVAVAVAVTVGVSVAVAVGEGCATRERATSHPVANSGANRHAKTSVRVRDLCTLANMRNAIDPHRLHLSLPPLTHSTMTWGEQQSPVEHDVGEWA